MYAIASTDLSLCFLARKQISPNRSNTFLRKKHQRYAKRWKVKDCNLCCKYTPRAACARAMTFQDRRYWNVKSHHRWREINDTIFIGNLFCANSSGSHNTRKQDCIIKLYNQNKNRFKIYLMQTICAVWNNKVRMTLFHAYVFEIYTYIHLYIQKRQNNSWLFNIFLFNYFTDLIS